MANITLEHMPIFDKKTARVLATILLFAAVGAFVWGARRTLVAFLFAIFFAYVLDPVVSLVERQLSPGHRGRAILIVYVVMLGILALVLTLVGPKLATETPALGEKLPQLLEGFTTGQIAHQIGSRRGWSWTTQVRIEQFLASHSQAILTWARDIGSRAAELATNAIWLIIMPILAIFFLKDGREFSESLIQIVERRTQRQFLRGILEDLNVMLAAYIRAQVILAAISLVAYTTVLSILRVPYSFVLGALGGFAEFVPVVGPLVAAVCILGVAFLLNYQHLLLILVFLGLWRLMQDYVNAPRIMGRKVELHPLAALFAVLVGAEIGGVVGVYLSVPLIATLRILYRRWQKYESGQATVVTPAEVTRHR
ncbi:MAG: AI-2E family transporter [Terriglobales bacterium]